MAIIFESKTAKQITSILCIVSAIAIVTKTHSVYAQESKGSVAEDLDDESAPSTNSKATEPAAKEPVSKESVVPSPEAAVTPAPAKSEPELHLPPPKKVSKPVSRKEVQKNSSESSGYGKPSGLLGPFVIGPKITTLSIPMVFEGGLEAKLYDFIGFSYDYGIIPQVSVGGVDVSALASQFGLKIYPFHGSFYVGASYGQQKIKGTKSETVSGEDVHVEVNVESTILTPQIGWRWVWTGGFFMGMEFGWQIPSNPKTTITTNVPASLTTDPDYVKQYNDVKKAGDQIGGTALPHIALLQFGYFF